MKKMLTLVAGAAVLASTMGVANAQGKASGPFADVPTDHWAYQSVEKLRDAGIVIGYPDGTYGGRRAMTRYEFATAIARLLALIPPPAAPSANLNSNYVQKTDLTPYALKSQIPTTTGLAKQSDVDALRAEVTRRLQSNEGAITELRNLVNQFAPELKKLGADVAAANARIDALDKRLVAVEYEQRRVVITGDVNLLVRSDINTKPGKPNPIDKDGYRVGAGSKSLFNSPNVYHDILLNISGRVTDSAQAVVRINAGNYLGWLGSATEQSAGHAVSGAAQPAASTFNIYEAYLATPVSLGPLGGASAVLGRQGIQFTPYTLKAVDPDSYSSLPETDSGNVIVDGGKLELGVSSAHITAFAGKAGPIQNFSISANPGATRDGGLRPGSSSTGGSTYVQNPIDNIAGARMTFGNPDKWTIGATAVLARTTLPTVDPVKTGTPITTASVYGADFNGDLPFFGGHALSLDAEFATNPTGNGSKFGNVNSDKGNEAWKALVGFHLGGLALHGGYREIYTNFNAPGSWGKIGSWTNPTNIRGAEVSGVFGLSDKLSINTEANFYQGRYDVAAQSPLGKDDKLNRANIGVKYGLSSTSTFDLGYEWVQWDLKNKQGLLAAAGKPTEQYITIGYGQNLNKNTAVKLLYQVLDYTDKGTGFGGGDSKGGVLVGQASVKF
ncbi:MAG TPA: S-layer homology domain-containing protein [Capsulimonadaceae bacterium]|jgi:hypothetical protein